MMKMMVVMMRVVLRAGMILLSNRMKSISLMNSNRKKPTRMKKKTKIEWERERIERSEPGIRKHQLCQGQQWRRICC